eukprot:CAMPEP_0181324656 /NCGR_PEP_ID=MMETSP1101-20121128/20482_1 /TAXON_ID=46948 /ORGANISM="Rhodomonas abbreviata, Strain Caron Lab Isolate" /LENGTH=211 /DNA_ID=CAMNT_0023432859 /DNA_START=213 /DNA_END=844 /DNA_ORIENTATION=-
MAGMLERNIQADLHALKTDAGKKFPKLRDAAERADRHLREVGEGGAETDEDFAAALREAGEMLSPGLLAIETKNPRFTAMGLGYVSRLATYDAMDASFFQQVGMALRHGAEGSGDEGVQLRILQCITAAMQAPSLLASKEVVCQLTETVLALHSNKSPVISNTAAATLRQCICGLFEFAARASAPPALSPFQDAAAGGVAGGEKGEKGEEG